MVIKKFTYNGKNREVVVVEESEDYLKGFDISYISTEESKENARKLVENITDKKDPSLEPLFSYFRNFKKSSIQVEPIETGTNR